MKKIGKYIELNESDEYDRISLEYNNHYGIDLCNNQHICMNAISDRDVLDRIKDYSNLKKR